MNEFNAVEQWIIKVAEDMQSADVLLSVGLIDNSCYFSQQAGEKALKAYLVQFMNEVPYTHNLGHLCQLCIEYDESFIDIFRISSDLTTFAIRTRYPNATTYTAEDAEEAIQKASRIFMFVQERIDLNNNTSEVTP